MKNFIVLYHAPDSAFVESQEKGLDEMKKEAAAWMSWKEQCGDHMVDLGTPLLDPMRISNDGTSKEGEEAPKGYTILRADSKERVLELLQGHPHLAWHSTASIEVMECVPFMPG